ncbi:MAG TPA: hypothetical protein DD391_06710 [Clostridiales bacterium]|nr:hypothetical protein [Clostridiales bacterium]
MNTTSDSVTLSVYTNGDFVTDIFVKGKGTGSANSGVEQMYCMVAAAKVADPSLTTTEASNFILELIEAAPGNGKDYSKKKNGFKYTVSVDTGSTWLVIGK